MNTDNKSFMERLAAFIVDHRLAIGLIFAAMLVFSVISASWVKVEEDITYYLPEEAEARRGLTIMENEFITYGTARVMVKDISVEKAEDYAAQFAALDDVLLVSFDRTQQHYKDSAALFDLTFSDVSSAESSEKALQAVEALLEGEDVTVYSEVGFSLSALVAEQMLTVLIFVVIVVLAVLVFTSSTYAEIPVMILTFLTAALINIGTHFLMGTISFVSNSVGIVLQLALSVDYAIIFCNRYKEEHEKLGIREAVVKALAASIPEISASSLTTIAGLTAMAFMKFRLGADMGLTLIKSIVCSLLTVFLFMPCLLMLFGKAMDKSVHRRFVPKISFVGRFAYATRHVIPVLFVLLVLGGYAVFRHTQYAYSVDLVPAFRQTPMEAAQAEIDGRFGGSNTVAVLVPSGDYASEKALLDELSACDEVKSATGLAGIELGEGLGIADKVSPEEFADIAGVDSTTSRALFAYYAAEQGDHRAATGDLTGYRATLIDLFLFLHERVEAGDLELPAEQAETVSTLYTQLGLVRDQLQSDSYSRLILDLALPTQSSETFAFLDRIHSIAARYYSSDVVLTGNSVSALGFRDSFASDNMVVGLMSLLLVMVILFFTFKSFGMPLLLILVIQGSIWLNFAIATLQGNYVFFLCYLIVSAIQMGANIDYAIVVSSRYREFRETMGQKEAVITTLNLAFPTVITSGLMMVCSGLLIGFGVSQCIIAGMGYYVGTGTSISLVLILFALPQVLLLGDRFVDVTTLRSESSALLSFLGHHKKRLAAGLLAAAALFLFLAAPLGMIDGRRYARENNDRAGALFSSTHELRALAEKLESDGADIETLRYSFAEQLMTDEIGQELLSEGESQYAEGLEQYEAGKAQYEAGAAALAEAEAQYAAAEQQLQEGQAQYDEGLAAYNEGKAQYEAAEQQLQEGQAKYDAGLAAYNEGRAQYAAAEQQLQEGQAKYDAGLAAYNEGKARYDEGKAQYDEAKAQLDAVTPLYTAALALQQRVNELQAQYDAAVARGDTAQALLIGAQLRAAQAALDTQLGGTSMSSLIAQYQEAQAQLSEAEQQLSEGKAQLDAAEKELAEGKAALDEGYAQLDEAKAQLDEAEKELAEGKAALDDGYAQLDEGKAKLDASEKQLAEGKAALDEGYAQLSEGARQIEAGRGQLLAAYEQLQAGESALNDAAAELGQGREQLAENLEELNLSLTALDAYSSDLERLDSGLQLLSNEPGVKARLGRSAGALDILDAAEDYFQALLDSARKQKENARDLALLLLFAASLGLTAALLSLVGSDPKLTGLLAGAAGLMSLVGMMLWRRNCAMLSQLSPLAALLLAAGALLLAELLLRKKPAVPER